MIQMQILKKKQKKVKLPIRSTFWKSLFNLEEELICKSGDGVSLSLFILKPLFNFDGKKSKLGVLDNLPGV